jgi:predicted RNase H-like HicB family nuclease
MNPGRVKHSRIAKACVAISHPAATVSLYVSGMNLPAANARFRIAIHRVQGCYFAHVADLPGCFSRGATEVEAVENARTAIRAYLWLAQVLVDDAATVQLEISA